MGYRLFGAAMNRFILKIAKSAILDDTLPGFQAIRVRGQNNDVDITTLTIGTSFGLNNPMIPPASGR